MSQSTKPSGPPYLPTTIAIAGGHPNVHTDVPICGVLIAIYLSGAILNMFIFKQNIKRKHKFLISWAMFGFSMSRVATCVLRIAWATHPKNAGVTIAAQIFTNVGVLVEYLVALMLCIRVFRATHPAMGWNRIFRQGMKVAYALLLVSLLLTVAFTITSLYTLDLHLKNIALWIQRSAILYMVLFNILSLVLLLLSVVLPPAPNSENFGEGSIRSKQVILGVALFFLLFVVGFRMGTGWSNARPAAHPAWWQSKPAFYVILFGGEIAVLYLFLVSRIDRRFWVPNGSDGPGDYSKDDKEFVKSESA